MATNISPKQAEQMLKNGEAILIDVRDADLFNAEHISYATSIPLDQVAQKLTSLAEQPKKVIFQCTKGGKSQQACELATSLGDKVYNMEGGINAWKEANLSVISNDTKSKGGSCSTEQKPCCHGKLSLVRQMQITVGAALLLIYILSIIGLHFLIYLIPIIGIVLIIAGIVGCCPLMKILAQMPWNK